MPSFPCLVLLIHLLRHQSCSKYSDSQPPSCRTDTHRMVLRAVFPSYSLPPGTWMLRFDQTQTFRFGFFGVMGRSEGVFFLWEHMVSGYLFLCYKGLWSLVFIVSICYFMAFVCFISFCGGRNLLIGGFFFIC